MKRVAASAAVVLALVVLVLPSSADDAPGCEGLGEYREAMLEAAEPMVAFLDETGIVSASPLTISSNIWLAFSEEARAFNERLLEIEPPEWAVEFHRLQLDTTGMQEQSAKAIVESGPMAVLIFEETINDIEERKDSVPAAIAETCPDFAQFAADWDALDGEVDGTPVATPVR
ncbi:MAG: hypothetical protein MOGMAGMI_01865 [Candidatus Omnitrophica bacterium]|nr:hypothetical protein [Candidatus Omnitrophota bacterium]